MIGLVLTNAHAVIGGGSTLARKSKTEGATPSAKLAPPSSRRLEVTFEYIKSTQFRVIHADGAIGSVSPNGNLNMTFFSERPPIPRTLVHELNDDGTLGSNIPEQTVTRKGVVREMDVNVVMNVAAVTSLIDWLKDRQKEMIAQVASANSANQSPNKQRKH